MGIHTKKDLSEVKVVQYYRTESEAYIAAGLLIENGIPCTVDGSTLINITLPMGAMQLKLNVRAEDEARAKELLGITDF